MTARRTSGGPERTAGTTGNTGATGNVEEFALLVADVYELAGLLRRNGEAIARRHGQSQARWQLLSVISAGTWTVPAAANRLGITRQAVQRVADDLVAGGHARYDPNPAHVRSPLLEITASGRRTLDAITKEARTSNRTLLAGIAGDDLRQARQTLHAVAQRLTERRDA